MQRSQVGLLAALLSIVVLAAALVSTNIQPASAAVGDNCRSDVFTTEQGGSAAAKESFARNCGHSTWVDRPSQRCDWVSDPSDGWQCSGPTGSSDPRQEESPLVVPAGDPPSEPSQAGGTPSVCDFQSGSHNLEATRGMFQSECGRSWNEKIDKCDYSSQGWHCYQQRGSTTTTAVQPVQDSREPETALTVATQPDVPELTQLGRPGMISAEAYGGYAKVIWTRGSDSLGVNVYRSRDGGDFQSVASVNAPGTVLNDYRGRAGDSYYVISYGAEGSYSQRSPVITVTRRGEAPPDVVMGSRLSANVVQLAWGYNSGKVTGDYKVYRDNRLLADLKNEQPTYLDETAQSSRSHSYRVVASSGGSDGPSSVTLPIGSTPNPDKATVATGQYTNAAGLTGLADNIAEAQGEAILEVGLAGGALMIPGGQVGVFTRVVQWVGRILFASARPAYREYNYGDWSPLADPIADFEEGVNDFLEGQGSNVRLPMIDPAIRFNVNHPDFDQWGFAAGARGQMVRDIRAAQAACGCKLSNATVKEIVERRIEEARRRGLRGTVVNECVGGESAASGCTQTTGPETTAPTFTLPDLTTPTTQPSNYVTTVQTTTPTTQPSNYVTTQTTSGSDGTNPPQTSPPQTSPPQSVVDCLAGRSC